MAREGAISLRITKSRLGTVLNARYALGWIGLFIVLTIVLVAIFASRIAPYSPNEISLGDRLLPPLAYDKTGGTHLLGTDQLGRDVLSRIIFGSRISLVVSVIAVVLAGTAGLIAGMGSGYWGGLYEVIIMRLVDLQLAFPFILLAMVIVSILGPTLPNIILVFIITGWPIYARTTRASVLSTRNKEYVEAARSIGAEWWRILFRHILPNILPPLFVIASFEMARVIIVEAALGFLGLSVPPIIPTWGNMLADGRVYIRDAWWLSAFPGIAIMLFAAAVNFLGDALRDMIDPRMRW